MLPYVPLKVYFRICHFEYPRKSGGVGTEYDNQLLIYANDNLLGKNM
jgi:hypothetical protein